MATAFAQSKYPIKLVLLERVSSGIKVGSKVPMLVAQDVKDKSGKVVIKADTSAYADVVVSRKSGTISNVLATPARLELKFENTFSAGKKPLSLESSSGTDFLVLNRKNTSEMPRDPKVEAAWKNPQQRELIENLVSCYTANSPCALSAQQASLLQQNASSLSLTNTAQLCQSGHFSVLNGFMTSLRSGSNFVCPAGVELATVCSCAVEVANLCHRSSGYLGGRFAGRNIVAEPGTEIEAVVVGP
jgi:hypothetical protein